MKLMYSLTVNDSVAMKCCCRNPDTLTIFSFVRLQPFRYILPSPNYNKYSRKYMKRLYFLVVTYV